MERKLTMKQGMASLSLALLVGVSGFATVASAESMQQVATLPPMTEALREADTALKLAGAHLREGRNEQALRALNTAAGMLQQSASSSQSAALASMALQLVERGFSASQAAQMALMHAKSAASALQPAVAAYANALLSKLYWLNGDYAGALVYSDRAASAAEGSERALVYVEWQRGRAHHGLGDQDRALAALRRAVQHLEVTRYDIPVSYENGQSSFRATFGPLYMDLVEALLAKAGESSGAAQQDLYRQAQSVVESIKRTELEDYFNNRCVVASNGKSLSEGVVSGAATLYPIVFDDRLEVLMGIGDKLYHHSVAVDAKKIRYTARTLAKGLRNEASESLFMRRAQSMYTWLLEPFKAELAQNDIDTIVYLPDGALRLVPLGVLHDGSSYVVENFAIATSPGLSVSVDSNEQIGGNWLIAGVSQPGDVVDNLPSGIISEITGGDETRGIPSTLELQQQFAIPGVLEEVETLSQRVSGDVLINQTFSKQNLTDALTSKQYDVVHLASHGIFGDSADSSFIMAHDQIVSMSELERLLRSSTSGKAIGLMTLSACQTAEGDDRAPLGFSGMAIQSNVESALGSLWSISDQATVELMTAFYDGLGSTVNRAQALRQAQRQLIHSDKFSHPFYWSPFVLVGDWM